LEYKNLWGVVLCNFHYSETTLYTYNLYRIQTRQVCQITIVCINGNHFSGYKRMNNFVESIQDHLVPIFQTEIYYQIIHLPPSLPVIFLFAQLWFTEALRCDSQSAKIKETCPQETHLSYHHHHHQYYDYWTKSEPFSL